MKFHFNSNIVEGTPEELVKYQELLEADNSKKSLFPFGHEHQLTEEEKQVTFQGLLGSLKIDKSSIGSTESSADEVETASTEFKVGDRVKVLESASGAEGVATVTDVLEDGNVLIAGTSNYGTYLPNWSSHTSFLEKIEAEEDSPMGYTFWYIDGVSLNHLNVLKTSIDGYFEDSKGRRYTHYAVRGLVKPVDNAYVREEFEDAKHNGKLLKYYPTLDEFAWK